MLTLSSRPGEKIFFILPDGTEITATTLGNRGNQTRTGFDAPKHIKIYREEVYNRIKEEQQEAQA